MARPSLSVVMANYNHGRFLAESVGAILQQSYRPCQLVIVDDASTDDSVEILEARARDDACIQLLRNESNEGVIASFARGLAQASGDYVYFAAADDRVLPGLFERSMRLLAQHPSAGVCSSLAVLIDQHGRECGLAHSPVISSRECFLSPDRALRALRSYGPWVKGTTAVCRREALLEVGPSIPELESYSDSFIDLVLAMKYGACFIPEPLAAWRRLETGYASRLEGNAAQSLDIVERGAELMRNRYRDIFPPDCVQLWLDYQRYSIALAAYGRYRARRDRSWKELQPLDSWLTRRGFAAGRQALAKAQDLAVKASLFGRFRRPIGPTVAAALAHKLRSTRCR